MTEKMGPTQSYFLTPTKHSDSNLEEKMVGTWWGERRSFIYEGQEARVYGEKTYMPDGTSSGFISEQVLTQDWFVELVRQTFASEWRVANGVLESFNIRYLPPEEGQDGLVLSDRIVSINATEAVFEDLSKGNRFSRYRK